jgi:hypothetical protein
MVTSSGTILGTARMGDDHRQSVVDRDLRAHDHSNLFIVGGMVFPTAGVNPLNHRRAGSQSIRPNQAGLGAVARS